MMNRRSVAAFVYVGVVVLALAVTLSQAYSGVIPPDPENPGKCVYRGDTLTAGVNNSTTPCQRLTCQDDGSIKIEGCGKLRLENCNRGERIETTKPYPECCKLRYKCKKPDGTPYFVDRDAAGDSKKSENSA